MKLLKLAAAGGLLSTAILINGIAQADEIVARLSADIGPGRTHTKESVAAAVEGFTVGYEVLDRRASPALNTFCARMAGARRDTNRDDR